MVVRRDPDADHDILEVVVSSRCRKVLEANAMLLTADAERARHAQRRPLVECLWVKASLDFIDAGNVLELTAANDVFDVSETARSTLLRDLHHDRWAPFSVLQGYRVHAGPALGIVLFQGPFKCRPSRQREGEHARIDDGLTAGLGPDRPHGMSRVAEQRHPAKTPARQGVAIA